MIPGRKSAQDLADKLHEPVTLWRRGSKFIVQPSAVLVTSAERIEEVSPRGESVHQSQVRSREES